ncbi:MAG: glycosyltransferase family 2 protein [Armatimonadetes bacterium]|nr:glycosyltransferase family 2 protein [Armatimonadota bacterium]
MSVLLTCYNHLEYLPECFEACIGQTYRDFEIVCLDDGSKDGTRDWLHQRVERGTDGIPVYLEFNEKNLGTYGSLNRGIEISKGEFLCILNDDDIWGPNKLASQIEIMESDPQIGLCSTGGWFIDGNGSRVDGKPLGFFFPHLPTGDRFPDLMEHNKLITSSAMFRRSAVDRVGLFDPSYYGCGDWHMWLRITEHFKFGYAAGDHTFYRVHETNASRDDDKMNLDDLMVREWLADRLEDLRPRMAHDERLRNAMAHALACLGTTRTWNGDPRGGRSAYAKSLSLIPWRFKSILRWGATYLPRKTFRKLN